MHKSIPCESRVRDDRLGALLDDFAESMPSTHRAFLRELRTTLQGCSARDAVLAARRCAPQLAREGG